MSTAYLGLDLHANSCTLGVMAEDGTYQDHQQFPTAESELVPRVSSIEAREKRLAVEASELCRWAAGTLDPYVDQVLVCDARENYLISRDARRGDDGTPSWGIGSALRLRSLAGGAALLRPESLRAGNRDLQGRDQDLEKRSVSIPQSARQATFALVQGAGPFATYFERKRSEGTGYWKAIVATMRKLCKVLYGLARSGTSYDPARVSTCESQYASAGA